MAKIFLFRGKSATGKTTLSNALSRRINACVLRKDDIFDPLSRFLPDNAENNAASYDILANLIMQNLNAGADVIVDVALPHAASYRLFLSKLDLQGHQAYTFLCDCTDESIWRRRWEKRLKDPLPNQYFKSIDEVATHYANMDSSLLPGEIYLDSAKPEDELLRIIFQQAGLEDGR